MSKKYIYVFSNPAWPADIIKVGKTDDDPAIRAKSLSRTQPARCVVEWYMEVPDSDVAEKIAHAILKKFKHGDTKEFFEVDVHQAVALIKKKVLDALDLNNPRCYEGDKLIALTTQAAVKSTVIPSAASSDTKQGKQDTGTKNPQTPNPQQFELELEATEYMNQVDRLEKFVHGVHAKWRKANRGLAGLFSKQVGDEGEDYIMRVLSEKLGFDAVTTPASQTPVDVVGLKWRGYFWQLIMIQVKTSTIKSAYELSDKEFQAIRDFGRFVKEEYLASELYRDYADKPIAFSVGLANVKNHRPAQPRCTLNNAYFINWYWSKLPREKLARIQELVEEAHSLK